MPNYATIPLMDDRGNPSAALTVTGFILTEWLLVAAEITHQFQYYFWAVVVVLAWAEAAHNRQPRRYPQRSIRWMIFLMLYLMPLLAFNKMVVYIQQFGIPLP